MIEELRGVDFHFHLDGPFFPTGSPRLVRDKEAEQWTSKVMPSQEGKEINLRRSLISAGLWLHKL
jgi:hypothetical protein